MILQEEYNNSTSIHQYLVIINMIIVLLCLLLYCTVLYYLYCITVRTKSRTVVCALTHKRRQKKEEKEERSAWNITSRATQLEVMWAAQNTGNRKREESYVRRLRLVARADCCLLVAQAMIATDKLGDESCVLQPQFYISLQFDFRAFTFLLFRILEHGPRKALNEPGTTLQRWSEGTYFSRWSGRCSDVR